MSLFSAVPKETFPFPDNPSNSSLFLHATELYTAFGVPSTAFLWFCAKVALTTVVPVVALSPVRPSPIKVFTIRISPLLSVKSMPVILAREATFFNVSLPSPEALARTPVLPLRNVKPSTVTGLPLVLTSNRMVFPSLADITVGWPKSCLPASL